MKAPLPQNEAERLAALRDLGILDTPPELAYDELSALAAYICQTPIALISLVDEDRQWFKSRVGWRVQNIEAAQGGHPFYFLFGQRSIHGCSPQPVTY